MVFLHSEELSRVHFQFRMEVCADENRKLISGQSERQTLLTGHGHALVDLPQDIGHLDLLEQAQQLGEGQSEPLPRTLPAGRKTARQPADAVRQLRAQCRISLWLWCGTDKEELRE